MSTPVTPATRRNQIRIARGALAALAFVLVAGACASSSPKATPKAKVKATSPTTKVATTTTVPTVPGVGPIKLVSVTGVTPVEVHRAEKLIASTFAGLKRFKTPADAYALGYRTI